MGGPLFLRLCGKIRAVIGFCDVYTFGMRMN